MVCHSIISSDDEVLGRRAEAIADFRKAQSIDSADQAASNSSACSVSDRVPFKFCSKGRPAIRLVRAA